MRTAWRLCSARYQKSAFNGEGSYRYGGRWNYAGTRVVYTAESKSLASLELLVGLDRNEVPPDMVCFRVDIPDSVSLEETPLADFPVNWSDNPGSDQLKELGSAWAQSRRSLVLVVPSPVTPGEVNLLLNPEHKEFSQLGIGEPEAFRHDGRLFK